MRKQVILVSLFVVLLVVVLMQSAPFVTAEGKTIVVGNTQDWHSLYLTSIYASLHNASFFFFNNRGDAQLKTKTMGLNDEITIFESTVDPVVKNYKSFLSVAGFNNYKSYSFEGFESLQKLLVNKNDVDGYVVFGTDFGMEPLAAAPYLVKNNYLPLFYSDSALDFITKQSKKKQTIFVGRIPVRPIASLPGSRLFGSPQQSTTKISKLAIDALPSEWGIITRVDVVDFQTFSEKIPLFVFYGDSYSDAVSNLILYSNITKYEVIGGKTADIASSLETQTGKDLKLLLKYGRRVTNLAGLQDTVLDVDSYSFPFPVEDLEIIETKYYPKLNTLAITYKNTGNINLLYFSNIEYGGVALADNFAHQISPGEQKTVPFSVLNASSDEIAITSKFGNSIPFKKSLLGDNGAPIFTRNVSIDSYAESTSFNYIASHFDSKQGVLTLEFENPGSETLQVYGELLYTQDKVYGSPLAVINPKETGNIKFSFPYVSNDELEGKEFTVKMYYGHKDTLNTQTISVLIEKTKDGISMYVLVLLIVLLLLFLFFLLFWKRRKKKKNNQDKLTSAKAPARKKQRRYSSTKKKKK